MKKLYVLLLAAGFVACQSEDGGQSEANNSIDLSLMDTTVRAQDDFFTYVNGKWVENTEIPGDQGRWGSFNELRESSSETVKSVLENALNSGELKEGSDEYKAGLFYNVGMDSMLAENVGMKPLQRYFELIDNISDKKSLQDYIVNDHKRGGSAFFGFGVMADLKDSEINAAYMWQSGLGLPDRDYYFKDDSVSKNLREEYVKHVQRMFEMTGDDAAVAAEKASTVMAMETILADSSRTRVEMRNIPALYNKYAVSDLSSLNDEINWNEYFAGIGLPELDSIVVSVPEFLQGVDGIIAKGDVESWKAYLKWHLINRYANYLNHEIVAADFEFFSKKLRGTEEMRPRWKRVLGMVNGVAGEAVGKLYVAEAFPAEAKTKAKEMVDNILDAFGDRIKNLDWMTDSTKTKALEKLGTITVKIGYPDEWKDYSELVITENSLVENVISASEWNFKEEIEKVGKPVDRKEWGMTPQTVNAYYNPLNNEIVFPAAILQPPFFDFKADDAVNYGGIGAVIGHEVSHGFDDNGSRFDSEGNMVNWWSETDAEQFKSKSEVLISQFDAFEALPDVHVNGKLTLGENIGDLCGLSVAYDGLMDHYANTEKPGEIAGFTPEQRFFMSWATIWRIKYRDETLRNQIQTDSHSPGMFRANGPLKNIDSFYSAFGVKEGDGMYIPQSERVVIW
ncbi:M13 family metallopeptidase [Marinigracilibium pacificum]|uniref:M13 family metallopeptidase n=1 Tax=Marinigracilibium pacificum TaxID=2729599 RepID=A0A848J209_9BACT|nr:M13 family metallopeptidase [Marinigracilibium pacificum]NMM50617.1 M13 family metallopeptidase [Marinigracilibium pacificum]